MDATVEINNFLDSMENYPAMHGVNVHDLELQYHLLLRLRSCILTGGPTTFFAARRNLYSKLFSTGNLGLDHYLEPDNLRRAAEILKELRKVSP